MTGSTYFAPAAPAEDDASITAAASVQAPSTSPSKSRRSPGRSNIASCILSPCRKQQQQQQHKHKHKHRRCGLGTWMERSIVLAIALLVSVGLLYSNRLLVSDLDLDLAREEHTVYGRLSSFADSGEENRGIRHGSALHRYPNGKSHRRGRGRGRGGRHTWQKMRNEQTTEDRKLRTPARAVIETATSDSEPEISDEVLRGSIHIVNHNGGNALPRADASGNELQQQQHQQQEPATPPPEEKRNVKRGSNDETEKHQREGEGEGDGNGNNHNNNNNNNQNDGELEPATPPPEEKRDAERGSNDETENHNSGDHDNNSQNNDDQEPAPPSSREKQNGERSSNDETDNRQREESNKNSEQSGGDDRLNIVLFYADDWSMSVLGKLNPNVKTPNIDKLADQGILFVNNCVTTSVCWMSRATLMTGTYYSRHLQSDTGSQNMFQTNDWDETLFPRLRRDGGYYTGMIGKWHAPQPPDKMDAAFDEHSKLYYGDHWLDWYSPANDKKLEHVTELNRRHSIDFLKQRPRDKPFALKVSFFATHARDDKSPPYQPQNASRFVLYPDDPKHENYTVLQPPPSATEGHWNDLPYFFHKDNAGRLRWKDRFEPHLWQSTIRDVYAMATEVDWAIGAIIDELKEQGVYDNTLLVFTTDNGNLVGEHGLAEKWYPFEEAIKVPLVVVDPRMDASHHGTVRNEWTLNVDLAPTLLGAAGLEASDFMQGRDVADLYLTRTTTKTKEEEGEEEGEEQGANGESEPWRTDWFYEWNMGDPVDAAGHAQEHFIDAAFALITDEWKYVYWPQKKYEQLFHRSLDYYDEYDILRNFYLQRERQERRKRGEETEPPNTFLVEPVLNLDFFQNWTTPFGDSVGSTAEVYNTLKARFHELKDRVRRGNRI